VIFGFGRRRRGRITYATRAQPFLPPLLLCALVLLSGCTVGVQPRSKASPTFGPTALTYDFPAVDANYVYDQLYYMSTKFLQRESGFDLSAEHNGHHAFAQYWAQQMQTNLQGFAPVVTYDTFTGGWISRPAESPSYNVEVTIAGALHPEQIVVVGSHYDGMHVSLGSAFDDTSGCAILLGEARALADYWRGHHLYPARTVRFVLFDAEEEGILGSYHYVNSTVNGDTSNIVAMLNEEQSSFSYPVRFLGQASNPVIPLHVWNVDGSKEFFNNLMRSALPVVSGEMRTLGYTSVTYHSAQGQPVTMPVFTPEQIPQMLVTGDLLGGSDDVGFDQANVPALTFIAGDEGVQDPTTGQYQTPNIPANEAYPFDTHLDTIQLINGYANGETQKSQALVLALEFQTMLQAWMINQPELVGNVTFDQLPTGPLATISDIGILKPGVVVKLAAQSAFDPRAAQSQLQYTWSFGDGSGASGAQVQHTYAASGTYTLELTVQSATGTRHISKQLLVTENSPAYVNVFLPILQQERARGSGLAQGDYQPPSDYQMPPIRHDGDGLTSADRFLG
jgi:Peptidase family M28/PKD domain